MNYRRMFGNFTTTLLVMMVVAAGSNEACAQKKPRGGARPSMGRVGGSGARPSASRAKAPSRPNVSRPAASRPNVSRPNTSRPSTSRPSTSRPSFGNANARPSAKLPSSGAGGRNSLGGARPSLGGAGQKPKLKPSSRPNVGNQRPSTGNRPTLPQTRPNTSRPTLPTSRDRPNVRPPGSLKPTTRPSTGLGQTRPSTRPSTPTGNNRPTIGNRPATFPGGNKRPDKPTLGNVNRPTTLPGVLPGSGNRPGVGGGNRPEIGGNRPTTLPGAADRPGIGGGNRPGIGGGNRPGIGGSNRPGIGDGINRPGNRPDFGGGNNRPGGRPIIGGNRPNFGGNTNININDNNFNIGNKVGISNRPRWDVDPGYSRPAWGIGGNNWHDRWYDNGIHNHYHGWYNGCWSGNYWNSNWYAPVAWGAVGWGLGSLTSSWGYGTSYYNPYYAEPAIAQAVPYDYSQPIVVNNYVSSDADAQGGNTQGGEVEIQQSVEQQAFSSFDEGLERFKAGSYQEALTSFDTALLQMPGDPVIHEMRCLALFATGNYSQAAAGLNSLLASAPGMDWTTMSGLYGNPDSYTQQLRSLEQYCLANPNDAPAHFVLAYHYLVTGNKDAASDALKVVVKNQPKDATAKRMLDALAPPEVATPVPVPDPTAVAAGEQAPETDLVGTWIAKTGSTQIELAISEDSQFTWKAISDGQESAVLSGNLVTSNDGIELDTAEQGAMAGSVKSNGPDAWQFNISGAPASDPGLAFVRSK